MEISVTGGEKNENILSTSYKFILTSMETFNGYLGKIKKLCNCFQIVFKYSIQLSITIKSDALLRAT